MHDLVALADCWPPSSVSAVAVRRKWMTGVAQRTISSTAVGDTPSMSSIHGCFWSGWRVSSQQAMAHGGAGGLVAGHHQQHEERAQLAGA